MQGDHDKRLAKANSQQAFSGSAKSSLAEVKELVVDISDGESPDGESLRSQWAKIEASKHPAQVLKATDRPKLRTAIAALVESVTIQPDRSAEILFKSGITRHVPILKCVDVGWGKVTKVN